MLKLTFDDYEKWVKAQPEFRNDPYANKIWQRWGEQEEQNKALEHHYELWLARKARAMDSIIAFFGAMESEWQTAAIAVLGEEYFA